MNNFSTHVAIVTGLENGFVKKSMRRLWSNVGSRDKRSFELFQLWATKDGDFKHIRSAVDALEANMKADARDEAHSVASGGAKGKAHADSPSACIPFVGIYLSQIRRINELPDLIDPTAPRQPVIMDPLNYTFSPPAQPHVFDALPPLPTNISIEPLINVQKQRRIAGVVKSLVCGQHMAVRVHHNIDRKLYQRCLRLRALDWEGLQRAAGMYGE
jgi:GDP/GTP exchange factor required for growth at low temperature